jgi:hypothetical protein
MAHRRSLGCARDDKKERVVVRRGRLLEERAVAGGKGGCWRKRRLLEGRAVAQRNGLCQRERDAFSINNCPSPSRVDHLTIQTVARLRSG